MVIVQKEYSIVQKKIPFYFKSNYTKDRLMLRNLISSVFDFFGQRQGCYLLCVQNCIQSKFKALKQFFNFLYFTYFLDKQKN